jgi:hypothetical protein
MLAACNAIVGFDDLVRLDDTDGGPAEGGPPPGDGGMEADVRADDADAARCNPLLPFYLPELEEGLSEGDGGKARDAVLTLDELEIFFVRIAPGDVTTLRHGRRSDRTKPWTGTQLDIEPLSPVPTTGLSIAAGGLRLYFRDSVGSTNYVATRPATNMPFTSPMAYLAPSIQGPMFVGASNDTVYGRFRPDSGTETVLGRGTNTGTGSTSFQVIPNIHVAGATDEHPVLNGSETRLYFTSQLSGELVRAIYVATRASKAGEFGAPTHVGALFAFGLENAVTWVSDDDCEVLLNRLGDVYHARRPR